MCDRPHLYPPDFDAAALADLKSVLDSCHLQVTNLNSFTLFAVGDTYLPSWIEPDKARREIRVRHTLECLEVAQALGAANISIPPGGPLEKGMGRDEAFRLFYAGRAKALAADFVSYDFENWCDLPPRAGDQVIHTPSTPSAPGKAQTWPGSALKPALSTHARCAAGATD